MGKKKLRKDQFADREAQKYSNPVPSREYILEYLTERGTPATYRQIISELDLQSPEDQEAIRRRLIAMSRDGQLHQNRRGAYGLLSEMELIHGHVLGHKDGFGFVKPEAGGDDLFLSPRQMRSVFPKDKVLARVTGIDPRGRREAIIVEVIEHNTRTLVGRLVTESGVTYVEPANQKIVHDILIPSKAKSKAKNGQMVIVEITTYPTVSSPPIGQVIGILGNHMAPGMEIEVAINNHEIPYEWPDQVLEEAGQFVKEPTPAEWGNRRDLRQLPFVTIDGEDAKDFDDAVCCIRQAKGGWILYVAIADVSHYVKPNTALDVEACNRGNSVYFPGQVIPMLPETLSNELCSLKPQVNRLTLVAEMAISPTGKVSHFSFHEAVIFSHARLTYNEVYAMMVKQEENLRKRHEKIISPLQALFDVYHVLKTLREKRGAIDFDLPETRIIFGEGRKIERIIPTTRNDAHRVIEECMLCANICAAHFLKEHKVPSLFRIHQGPSPQKLTDLRQFLRELNLKFPARAEPSSRDYSNLLKSIGDRPDAHLIQTMLLRSLSQAVYSPENKGHFGLAYDAYAHFTSPIRRYPDLLVHRAIRQVLQGVAPSDEKDNRLEKLGEYCSMTERRADEATREAVDWLKCEYMLDKVGENFPGVISGVTSFGLFVELSDIYTEGLLHISALHNDYYRFDPVKHCLFAERSQQYYRLGDTLVVKVARVDLDSRQIDLVLAEEKPSQPKKPKKKKGKPRKHG